MVGFRKQRQVLTVTVIPQLKLLRFTLTQGYATFKSRQFVICLREKKMLKLGKLVMCVLCVIEEDVDLVSQNILEGVGDDVQKLLDFHNQELIEMHKQHIEEL
ncbi:hypothetical protein TNCV_2008711 [Trichonephila clavipes]|nr:hypothetical protein TNCV_2008711 [Trichonephila clavipes]